MDSLSLIPKKKDLIDSGFCPWIYEKLVTIFQEPFFPLDIALSIVSTYIVLLFEDATIIYKLILVGDGGV
jgi:hypothetical protein